MESANKQCGMADNNKRYPRKPHGQRFIQNQRYCQYRRTKDGNHISYRRRFYTYSQRHAGGRSYINLVSWLVEPNVSGRQFYRKRKLQYHMGATIKQCVMADRNKRHPRKPGVFTK